MSARSWWRRVRGGRALQLAEEEIEFQSEKAADRELVIASYAVQLAAERERADTAQRERDAWRLRARSAPLTPVGEEHERAVRHADAEQTGGR